MNGILLIDKPKGWTSFDVVAKARGILKRGGINKPKVGHTGTLDPLATGLLVLLVGNYTKKATELSKLDKTYEVEMKLGLTSTTADEEGEKTPISDKKPTKNGIEEALHGFVGEIEQTPPIYSAIKVNGQRAYKLARAGKPVALEPRKVAIYFIRNTKYRYPYVSFETRVSSGTYIRSLVEDVGKKLGTGAYMSNLNRTEVGQFTINDAHQIEDLTDEEIAKYLQK